MSYILGARGFSWAGSGFGSAEDEAPRRTREKKLWYPGYMSYRAARNFGGGGGGGGAGVYFLRFFQQSTKISSHE